MSELITRENAKQAICEVCYMFKYIVGSYTECRYYPCDDIKVLEALPSAEAEPTVIRSRTFMPTKDFKEWAKRIREVNPNAVVIPCDAEVVSAETVQGWIPCSERLPLVGGEFLVTLVDNDGTWVSTAKWNMTFGGRWQDIFPDDGYRDISNVIAWKTLPKPYKGGGDE